MRIKLGRILSFNLFLYASTLVVHAQNYDKGYTLQPLNPQDNVNYWAGDLSLINFFQLPLWVQIFILLAIGTVAVSIIYYLPLLTGRLKHALENPKTKEIFYFIQRNPGMTIAELSEEQNMNRGTLKYHLSQLLTNNKVVFIKKGKFSRLFYNNSSILDKENIVSRYLRNDKSRDILFTIMDMPGVTNQELSSRFDLAKSTTHEYLKSFSDDDIVEFRQDGKFKRCYVKQDARMILLRFRPQ
jgi:predicted transcriptional regulator